MKVAIFFALIALCAGSTLTRSGSFGNIENLVKENNYAYERFEVQTEDGYIMELYRVFDVQNRKQQSDKEAVLLFHGYLYNCEEFAMGGDAESLAFYLVQQGYEVYLANARGTTYGMRHIHLNPKTDAAFWRFSFHDIGTKDLPAIVDKVLEVSKRSKIHFVAHMEGTSASYVFLSEKPEYNQKIERLVSLGPMAYMVNSEQEIINLALRNNKAWYHKNLGISTFTPSEEIINEVRTKCINEKYEQRVCENVYFLYNGFNSVDYNTTTIERVLSKVPSTGSVRDLLHFVQLKKSGRFERYDENFVSKQQGASGVQEYDLSKITVPVGVIYTPRDKFAHADDVKFLISKLPKVFAQRLFDDMYNNMDLIFNKNAEKVNEVVMHFIKGNSVY
ncbi:unnamed protein product [Brassicogethes aeneus]|uniref:Lipase n=1 Tax=Brassicogethes aeneus TaxID=1431903 RepID=A0A9P0B8F9_BRAAE|nr:unnamed protein product [Brassicogethes aeneus]